MPIPFRSEHADDPCTVCHSVPHKRGCRYGVGQVAVSVGVESLPLDPSPWRSENGNVRSGDWEPTADAFEPRPGFEQRREFYEEGGK